MKFWQKLHQLRLKVLGRFFWEMTDLEKQAPCSASTLRWYEAEIVDGNQANIGICWYWPDKSHWKEDKPGQKHSIGYYFVDGVRHYIEPQENNRPIKLSENELSLAQHFDP